MKHLKKLVLSAALSCVMLANVSYAASIQDMKVEGWENIPEDEQAIIEDGIKDIPDSVARYHKTYRAKVSFIHDYLSQYGYKDEVIKGLYYHASSDIEISTADKWNTNDIYDTVAHELGHFLYAKTYVLWSERSKNILTSQFEYWRQYISVCNDEDETFALVYALYRAHNSPFLNAECKEMIEEAERICDKLYELDMEGSTLEIGPGSLEQLKNILEQEE